MMTISVVKIMTNTTSDCEIICAESKRRLVSGAGVQESWEAC